MIGSSTNTYGVVALVNFAFYGVKSLLLLYLTQDLAMDMQEAVALCTGMIACSYLISLVGGFFASQLVDLKTCLVTSLSLFNLGIFLLAFSHHQQLMLYMGITLFICGGGLFKPLIPLILDQSIMSGSKNRERGFMIYYAALNVGSLFGFIICGFSSQFYGKNLGFFAAGFSAILSLLLAYLDRSSSKDTLQKSSCRKTLAYFGSLFLIISLILLSIYFMAVFKLLFPLLLMGILLLFFSIYVNAPKSEKRPILLCYLAAFLFSIFAAIFEQTHSSLTLFLELKVNRGPFGIDSWISTIPTPVFNGLDPLFIIFFTVFMGMKKTDIAKKTFPCYGKKISFGFFVAALAFMILLGALSFYAEAEKVPMIWIILTYLCIAIAEICIVPTCLSAITAFSPVRLKGPFVALWTLSIAYGTYFSGIIVKYSTLVMPFVSNAPAQAIDFSGVFLIALLLCLIVGFILSGLSFFQSRR